MTAQVTLIGNLVRDPELRFTAKGDAVANFTIAVNERVKQGNDWVDGEPSYYDATAWRNLAEQVTEHLRKGSRVIAVGKMKIEKYEAKDGTQRSKPAITVDEIGSSIRFKPVGEPKPTADDMEDIPPF
jgi:single-strand DNA-binding protein